MLWAEVVPGQLLVVLGKKSDLHPIGTKTAFWMGLEVEYTVLGPPSHQVKGVVSNPWDEEASCDLLLPGTPGCQVEKEHTVPGSSRLLGLPSHPHPRLQ